MNVTNEGQKMTSKANSTTLSQWAPVFYLVSCSKQETETETLLTPFKHRYEYYRGRHFTFQSRKATAGTAYNNLEDPPPIPTKVVPSRCWF